MIGMGIRSVPTDSKVKFDEYIYHRNKAFLTFDFNKISKCMVKYGNQPPVDNAEFWGYVARTVLEMTDASERAIREAKRILDELNMNEDVANERNRDSRRAL